MNLHTEPGAIRRLWRGWRQHLCCLFIFLGATGSAALAEAPPSRPAASSYRYIQFTTDPWARAIINASGQVAFQVDRDGSPGVKFFDGRRIRDFGTLGGTRATVAGLNDRGQIAFNVVRNGNPRALFFDGRGVRDIGTLGGPRATVGAINELGQVAGSSSIRGGGGVVHPYRWSEATGMVDLGAFGLGDAVVTAMNDRWQLTGYASFPLDTISVQRGFFWSPRSGIADIGVLEEFSAPQAMNDAGTVVGIAGAGPQGILGFRWTRASGIGDMGTLPDEFTNVYDINNAGQVVGESPFTPGGFTHPFLWTPGQGLLDLGTGTADGGAATEVNEHGIVIGGVITRFITRGHGFIWTRATGMIEIGAGSPELGTSALDVNDRGQVVGSLGTRAFVWTRGQGFIDLNTLVSNRPRGLVFDTASAISESGEILARASSGLYLLRPTEGMRSPNLR